MSTSSPVPGTPSPPHYPETRRRFALLWRLIYDERRRHRLILIGALLALALVAGLTLLARVYTVLPVAIPSPIIP